MDYGDESGDEWYVVNQRRKPQCYRDLQRCG